MLIFCYIIRLLLSVIVYIMLKEMKINSLCIEQLLLLLLTHQPSQSTHTSCTAYIPSHALKKRAINAASQLAFHWWSSRPRPSLTKLIDTMFISGSRHKMSETVHLEKSVRPRISIQLAPCICGKGQKNGRVFLYCPTVDPTWSF